MKRLIWMCAAALALLILPMNALAQDGPLLKLLVRTEGKHLRARQNLEQILREHPEFWVELQAVAARLETQPAWLLNVMASESLFVAGARNRLPGQTASGLLQIIEDTAQGLGTTTAAIRQMSPVEQLRFVEKYFAPFRGRLDSLADVYTATFRGFIVEGGEMAVVAPLDDTRKEQRIYALNQWLDLNSDGRITKGELSTAALSIGRFQAADLADHRQNREPASHSASLYSGASAPRDRNFESRQTRSIYVRD
ncbi:MAG: hypothetical protein HONDAALG_02570 [Gammaproteobacteria bacterium]|nr:hypothetical protein [Gammaproteobacteria bacterium]